MLGHSKAIFFMTTLACVADIMSIGCPTKSLSSSVKKNISVYRKLTGKFITLLENNSFNVVYLLIFRPSLNKPLKSGHKAGGILQRKRK